MSRLIYLSLKIDFVLTNSADPDEMLHYHLGLHCLPKYPVFNGLTNLHGRNQLLPFVLVSDWLPLAMSQ